MVPITHLASLFFILLMLGCASKDATTSLLADIPVSTPNELARFSEVGADLLSHIGYNTIVLNDGHVLIPDRQLAKLFKVDRTGTWIETIGRQGNGPEEFQDISILSQSASGNIHLYDQMTKKVLVYDQDGKYKSEFVLPSKSRTDLLIDLFEVEDHRFLIVFQSFRFLNDPASEQVSSLVMYDRKQETFSPATSIKSRPSAVHVRGGASVRVPYAAADLLAFDPLTSDIYLFNSGGNTIAQLNASLDTVLVISFNLDRESITSAESDSLQAEFPEYWESMQRLLPERKAVADRMLIDHERNVWLKLNHTSDDEQWLVLSAQGELLRVVRLPKESMLTHVSKYHLGVRLDDTTFSLYEVPD